MIFCCSIIDTHTPQIGLGLTNLGGHKGCPLHHERRPHSRSVSEYFWNYCCLHLSTQTTVDRHGNLAAAHCIRIFVLRDATKHRVAKTHAYIESFTSCKLASMVGTRLRENDLYRSRTKKDKPNYASLPLSFAFGAHPTTSAHPHRSGIATQEHRRIKNDPKKNESQCG